MEFHEANLGGIALKAQKSLCESLWESLFESLAGISLKAQKSFHDITEVVELGHVYVFLYT